MELIADPGSPNEERYTFYNMIEIGRYREGHQPGESVLLVKDPAVSSRHCIITQTLDGRCFIRDVSRNGTRLDGRRLIPNLEVEVLEKQIISIGDQQEFLLAPVPGTGRVPSTLAYRSATVPISGLTMVTVAVGDICDYTVLVQRAASTKLQESVSRVFEKLGSEIVKYRGTVKEYQGDAILAFWEERTGKNQAIDACRAVIALDRLVREIAAKPSVWAVNFPLKMHWALATGPVFIDSFGPDCPTGLSMVGEPVVLAFRLEKFANDDTGPILACSATKERASSAFKFRNLGQMHAKGFERPDRVYALARERRFLGL